MGLNISLHKILEVTQEEDYGNPYEYVKTVSLDWFDFLRYSGDREFASSTLFKPVDEEQLYYRPFNLDETIIWIKSNIVDGNQNRLLKAIAAMKEDKDIVFHFSY